MITQGFILLDVDVVALNNAGKSAASNFDNAVATKKIAKNGRTYVYVSGQAWRYWWRDSLMKHFDWKVSPITRENKVAFTEADPIQYDDDDIFGYMRAAKETIIDDKGKEKKENVTVTRVSPLKNSAIISAGSVRVAENWSSMSRQHDDAVPYGKEEYSAIMKGMFSLDLEQAGTFSSYNKSGYKNISDDYRKAALKNGAFEIDDPYTKEKDGSPKKLIRIKKETRAKRVSETIKALKVISGGAMQTSNLGDVVPKFIILATMKTGNHPFSHVVVNSGINNELVSLNVEGLKQALEDYKDLFEGNIYIGKTEGFLNEYNVDLQKLASSNVKLMSVAQAIENYAEEVKKYIH